MRNKKELDPLMQNRYIFIYKNGEQGARTRLRMLISRSGRYRDALLCRIATHRASGAILLLYGLTFVLI